MHSHTLQICAATSKEAAIIIDQLRIKKASLTVKAINHKLRQQILKFIGDKGQTTVTELFSHLLLEQSVASQHLAILRKAGFVKTKRTGKFIYYSLNKEKLIHFNKIVDLILS